MTNDTIQSPPKPDCVPRPPADLAADRAVVLYDGGCAFCRRSVRLLKRFDWFDRLHVQDCRDLDRLPQTPVPLVPGRLLEAMHLVTPDRRRVYAGFGAVRWLAWRLPAMLPFAGLLALPGVPRLGGRLYRWVARNRYDLVPCADVACRVTRGA